VPYGDKAAAPTALTAMGVARQRSRTMTHCLKALSMDNHQPQCVSLDLETRAALPTIEAAFHLNRAEQTLRIWACKENGPLRPMRINGRLAWPVAELRRVLGVA
jgi:hypothetical protein